jgi:hypothetical protein
LILNASTFLELAWVEIWIKNWGILSLQDFYQDIEAKRSFLEQQASILEQQKKLDEENARIQKEKDLETARKEWEEKAKKEAEQRKKNTDEFIKKFSDCSSIQELKEQRVMMFTSISYEVERACKFLEDRIQALWEIENQERLEKEKKYQDFLKKNEWKYDSFFDKDWKRFLYKIVDEFTF